MTVALVTGGAGCLGTALLRTAPPGVRVVATQRSSPVEPRFAAHTVDLADAGAVDALVATLRPDVVVHAAYGKDDGERDIVRATRNVASACAACGAGVVHVSSDVVFDGDAAPYAEDAPRQPVHQYGLWKAHAEDEVTARCEDAAVIRTSLILGSSSTAWMVEALRGDGGTFHVDELRAPIAAADLARALWEIALLPASQRRGTWHVVGPEVLSRYALALLLADVHGLDASLARPGHCPPGRPRDLRLSTGRADGALGTRPRGATAVLAG